MKKILSALTLFALLLFALASCGHSHTYSEEWEYDDDNHWREPTCEDTEENIDFGAHSDTDDDGVCDLCEMEMHEHSFSIAWQNDDVKHWRESTCSHEGLKSGEANHVDEDENGLCDVCAYDGMHKHVFNTATWNFDETGHWHPGICTGVDHSDRRSEFAPHVTSENDGTCDVCDFDEMHIHTYDTTDFSYDDTHHWYKMTCEHGEVKYGASDHSTSQNDGTCDACGYDQMHIHTFSDSEYASNAEGHWFKANCGHDDYVFNLQPHSDTDTDNLCDTCARRLKYTVTVVITQPERITLVGDSVINAQISADVTVTVKVDSTYSLFITTGGGEIVGIPTTEAGITTYTVKLSAISEDITLTLVAKLENAYDLSTLPATPDVTETTKTVYKLADGSFSATDKSGTPYEITYVRGAIITYDDVLGTYKIEKVATIRSIKTGGTETTLEWEGVTYGASGEGITTVIPTRDFLGLTKGFSADSGTFEFLATETVTLEPKPLYVFETDLLVERSGAGYAIELFFPDDNGNYAANTSIFAKAGSNTLQASAMNAGSSAGALSDTAAEVGTVFNLRVEVAVNAENSGKMDYSLYINGILHSTATVVKVNNVRVRLFLRDDGPIRNSTVTLSNTRFVKYNLHNHTFDTSEWLYDEYGHWHASTCGHDVKGHYAEHDSATNSGVCDACGKENIHIHTASDTEYTGDVTGHWFKSTCGHEHYKAGFLPHVDTEDENGICDVCNRRISCVVTVDINSTYPILVTEGEIKGAPGTDVSFTVSVPSTHTLVVSGAEVLLAGEQSGVKTYTLTVAEIADDTTVTVSTKRDGGYKGTLYDTDPVNTTVTVYEKDGSFSLSDNGGEKYLITYVSNTYKRLDADLGSYKLIKLAKIVSIMNAAGGETTLTYQGVTYGASGDGVVTLIPSRDWLGITKGFTASGVSSDRTDITPITDATADTLYHFEADVKIEHATDTVGSYNPLIELTLPQAETGASQATMAIYYDSANGGRLTLYKFGGGTSTGEGVVIDARLNEVFNLKIDIVDSATAGSRDLIIYINGEAAATTTLSGVDCDGRFRLIVRDDANDRNTTVTLSNIYATKKQ